MEQKSKQFIALCKKHGVDHNKIPEITSFEDACKYLGKNPKKLPNVKGLDERYTKRLIADYKLSVIADALRQNIDVIYLDTNTWKYFAIFKVKADKKRPSGFALSCNRYANWTTTSSVGVRLCFQIADLAIYFGKQFIDLHTDHHLLT